MNPICGQWECDVAASTDPRIAELALNVGHSDTSGHLERLSFAVQDQFCTATHPQLVVWEDGSAACVDPLTNSRVLIQPVHNVVSVAPPSLPDTAVAQPVSADFSTAWLLLAVLLTYICGQIAAWRPR